MIGLDPVPPRWVEVYGKLAIIVREHRESVLVRYARGPGRYHSVGHDVLHRRADLDGVLPDPAWLQQAKASVRTCPIVLFELVHGLSTVDDEAALAARTHDFDTDAEGRPL